MQKVCDCLPWFLLGKLDASFPMCERYGNECFKRVVRQRNDMEDGCTKDCLPDCERAEYSWSGIAKS